MKKKGIVLHEVVSLLLGAIAGLLILVVSNTSKVDNTTKNTEVKKSESSQIQVPVQPSAPSAEDEQK